MQEIKIGNDMQDSYEEFETDKSESKNSEKKAKSPVKNKNINQTKAIELSSDDSSDSSDPEKEFDEQLKVFDNLLKDSNQSDEDSDIEHSNQIISL